MYVIINGVSSDTIQGLQVLSLPPITKPKMRRQVDTIDGRAGDIITELGYEAYDRTITVLLHHNYDLDAITAFFNTSGEIIFSNEPDKKYYFRLLEKIDYERAVQFKTANITFHVQPYKYPVNETPLTVSTTAWEGTDYDQTPYIFRATKDSSVEVGNREVIEQITGGTVAWNQLIKDEWITGSATAYGLTITNNGDGTVTINGTVTNKGSLGTPIYVYINSSAGTSFFHFTKDHKYLYLAPSLPSGVSGYSVLTGNTATTGYKQSNGPCIVKALQTADSYVFGRLESIANGAVFSNYKYYLNIIDLTQMFGSTIADYIYSLETATAGAGVSLFKSLFPNDYYPYNAGELMSVKTSAHKTYDANDNVLGNYPISPIELRGIPKLVNNKLTYDGDIYKADGSVTRRYRILDLGTMVWKASSAANCFYSSSFERAQLYASGTSVGMICPRYTIDGARGTAPYFGDDKTLRYFLRDPTSAVSEIYIHDSDYSDVSAFKTAMSGVYLVYELATPTTETTTPYTETQICDADGTEEFIDDRDVQVPVGHKTKYMQINDPAEITVPNAGNVPSAPTIQLTGSGAVGVYLGNAQTLQVNIPEDGITIDTEAQDATSNGQLANRSVTGDYDSVRLQPGDNDVSFSGDASAVITKYTRWV